MILAGSLTEEEHEKKERSKSVRKDENRQGPELNEGSPKTTKNRERRK